MFTCLNTSKLLAPLPKSSLRNKWNDKDRIGTLGNKTVWASFSQTQAVPTPVLFGWEREHVRRSSCMALSHPCSCKGNVHIGRAQRCLTPLEAKRHSPRADQGGEDTSEYVFGVCPRVK